MMLSTQRIKHLSWLAILLAAAGFPALADSRPNVIFIMTDDAGYGDLGVYGSQDIQTPNLDQMAADGLRLTDFYANGPVCSPTRAGFMSGRYQQRVNIEYPLFYASPGLPNTGHSLPQLLKDNGYATALMGKWHLGEKQGVSPNDHGFDYFFGFKGGYIDYYQHDRGSKNPDLWENDKEIKTEGYMTDLITERSMEYIKQHKDEPFFLSVQYNAPHWPYQQPEDPSVAVNNAWHLMPYDKNTSTREDYIGMMEHVDYSVGRILDTLEQQGLAQNTLVVYTNDNGGEWLADPGPLFNRKSSVWEGGIRVTTLARWPQMIPAGRVSDQVGITMDVTATILAITGTEVPEDLELDGINLMPIWSGQQPEVARTLFWRYGTDKAVRSDNWKMVVSSNGTFLFDLSVDVGERNDLAKVQQAVVAELWQQMNAWEKEVNQESVDRGLRDPASLVPRRKGPPPL